MNRTGASARLGFGVLWLLASGCALLSKGTVVAPHYYSPEAQGSNNEVPAPVASTPLELRLGEVGAASHLEERMSFRVRTSEVGYYDDRRWTEEPAEYLRRALEQELFERRHVRRIVAGAANTLDVELTAFEELRDPEPHVRLALRFTLHDDRQASLERSIVVERPLSAAADPAAEVASALGAALTIAVNKVSNAVIAALPATEATPCVNTEPPSATASAPVRH